MSDVMEKPATDVFGVLGVVSLEAQSDTPNANDTWSVYAFKEGAMRIGHATIIYGDPSLYTSTTSKITISQARELAAHLLAAADLAEAALGQERGI